MHPPEKPKLHPKGMLQRIDEAVQRKVSVIDGPNSVCDVRKLRVGMQSTVPSVFRGSTVRM
eukprot:356348-Chlamydomonas_euryale.AAC.12